MTTTEMTVTRGERADIDMDLVRRTVMPEGSTADDLALFAAVCRRTGLDPFARQIYALRLQGRLSIQASIDGFRLIAERSGRYGGQTGPEWCGQDGVWRDVWLEDSPPAAARVGVIRTDWQSPLHAVARWASYVQTRKDGSITPMWARMPDLMLGKAAEALALRRAFPAELSGIYAAEEMAQAAQRSTDDDAGPTVAADGPDRPLSALEALDLDQTIKAHPRCADVVAWAKRAGVPPLRSGRVTVGQRDDLLRAADELDTEEPCEPAEEVVF